MIDHTNFLKNLREDVIITRRPPDVPRKVAELPIVQNDSEASGSRQGHSETFEDFIQAEDSEESDDSDWWDSDYEAADGDDDLFADNVDKGVNDNNEYEEVEDREDDAALEDGDLQLREEVQAHLHTKFRTFNAEVDMTNPVFKVGMVFSGVKEFRKALQNYSIKK
jgi:hypothetical protein